MVPGIYDEKIQKIAPSGRWKLDDFVYSLFRKINRVNGTISVTKVINNTHDLAARV